ncbi:SCO6880 family protein [Amycolatopsis anabasis]|uniref:SCO6880 family protein n=1 Tax=Amycolatopsis anabasis TaxID=1840409 RepID=UPI00131B8E2D|nr:SCO6880 family protein [Amycolatopsis anabasis]
MTTNIRIYKGLSRREHAGWVLGLRPGQAFVCILLAVPVVMALAAGNLIEALMLTAICGPVAGLVVIPVRGRPAVRWLGHLALFQVGMVFGWSRWQSNVAGGRAVDPDEPDLPGVLTRLRFPDGPPLRDAGRVCLIHDTGEGRWGATARLTHGGVGMLSDAQCERLANRLGNLLLSIGHRDVIDRMSLLVRTVPDDGAEYEAWRHRNESADAPELARRATTELDRTVGAVSVRHEVFVTLSGTEEALRKPATAAGGGIAGRAAALYRVLDGLEDKLKALGAQSVKWLSGGELAEAIRTGFNPASAAVLAARHHSDRSDSSRGVAWATAGPTHAPTPTGRAYHHDGFATVSYSVLMPEAGTVFGSLGALLAVKTAGERRSLAIHYETLSQRRARSAVRGNRFRAGVVRDWKSSKGFNSTAADAREAGGARAQEKAVAAGHGIVRFAVATAVTVPSSWNLEDHAARVENDIAGRFQLLRMELAQDSSFVAAVLPVGIGLPRLRGGGL